MADDYACSPRTSAGFVDEEGQLTLVGSSLMTRLTIILASRSVMYPFGRNLVLVFVGAAGIIQNEATDHQ
jgi:hypothetical protein